MIEPPAANPPRPSTTRRLLTTSPPAREPRQRSLGTAAGSTWNGARVIGLTAAGSTDSVAAISTSPPLVRPTQTGLPSRMSFLSPKDSVILGCLTGIVLQRQADNDASGSDTYDVALAASGNNGASWSGAGTFGLEFTTIQFNDQADCGNLYRCRVRARDNAGNIGPWSPWERFGIGID